MSLAVAVGDAVQEGQLLLTLEPPQRGGGPAPAPERAPDTERASRRQRARRPARCARAPRDRARRRATRGRREAPRARAAHRAREPRGPARRGHVRRVRAAAVRRAGAPALARGADRAHARRRARRRASASVDGRRCVAMSYDYTVLAGTQGMRNHAKKDRLFEIAERRRLPVVLFAEGGGGRPGDVDMPIVAGLDCRAFELFAQLSGLVPLVGIASGYCFAGNAALLGCCDVVIATEDSSIGMGGPAMIEGGGLGVYDAGRRRTDRRPARQRRRRPARRRRRRGGRARQALPVLLPRRAPEPRRVVPDQSAAARADPRAAQARLRRAHASSRRCSTRARCSSCATASAPGC